MIRIVLNAALLALGLLLAIATGAIAQAPPPAATVPSATIGADHAGTANETADSKQRSLFASRGTSQTQPGAASGPFSRFSAWLMAAQHKVHRALASAVKDLKTGNPLWAILVLGGLSFAYGILHAAGPGHGKAVISSYVLANERTVKRGIALSFLAAAIQGLSALAIVGILVLVLRATSLDIKATEGWIETLSWGLVTLIGVWLFYTQVRALLAGRQQTGPHSAETPHTHHKAHDHNDAHGHEHAQAHGHKHSQSHDHHHGEDCGCGNAHIPAPDSLQGPWSWPKALAVAFSVGIRPCTGAIIVLVFAISQGLMWAGVFATFAMALGTAITVSALAALAVGSRELATRMAGEDSRWGWRIERAAGLGGAMLVIGLGTVFFMGSLQPAVPF